MPDVRAGRESGAGTQPAGPKATFDPDAVTSDAYEQLLQAKATIARQEGLDVDPGDISPVLKPHQRDMLDLDRVAA